MAKQLKIARLIRLFNFSLPRKKKMAVSPLNSRASYHARSISLPSRPHPLIPEFDELLCRLRASEATSSSSSSICNKLSGLRDLHDCVDNLLLFPFAQQTLAQCRHEQWVDELLDGSLRLLDICGMAKDALLHTREGAHELQSSMRRRRGSENGFSSEVEIYLTLRKKVKKGIHKALRNLRGMEKGCRFPVFNKDTETSSLISMLSEVDTATVNVFEALLSSIAGATKESKPSAWALVSKLMQHKRVACEEAAADHSEFEKVDNTLCTLFGSKNKSVNVVHVGNVHNEVAKLESSIQDLEEGIEFLSRRLIKTRVFLLNILSH